MPLDDQIYPAQVWTIQELEGSYTIVGRGAQALLARIGGENRG